MGSWVTYGLGSENDNLPGFVVLSSGREDTECWEVTCGAAGFCRRSTKACNVAPMAAILFCFCRTPKGCHARARRKTLDAIADLNRYQHQHVGDPETITRISQYELSFRMQMSVPEVMDISRETKETLDLYGAKPGHVSEAESAADPRRLYKGDDPTFANNCLLARRLVEKRRTIRSAVRLGLGSPWFVTWRID